MGILEVIAIIGLVLKAIHFGFPSEGTQKIIASVLTKLGDYFLIPV